MGRTGLGKSEQYWAKLPLRSGAGVRFIARTRRFVRWQRECWALRRYVGMGWYQLDAARQRRSFSATRAFDGLRRDSQSSRIVWRNEWFHLRRRDLRGHVGMGWDFMGTATCGRSRAAFRTLDELRFESAPHCVVWRFRWKLELIFR